MCHIVVNKCLESFIGCRHKSNRYNCPNFTRTVTGTDNSRLKWAMMWSSGWQPDFTSGEERPFFLCDSRITHCDLALVTPYVVVELGQFCSDKGFLLDGTKPFSEPMLTNHQWGVVEFTWPIHSKCLRCPSLKRLENCLFKYPAASRSQWVYVWCSVLLNEWTYVKVRCSARNLGILSTILYQVFLTFNVKRGRW